MVFYQNIVYEYLEVKKINITQLFKKKADMDSQEIVFINYYTYWSLAELLHRRIKGMYILPEWIDECIGSSSKQKDLRF